MRRRTGEAIRTVLADRLPRRGALRTIVGGATAGMLVAIGSKKLDMPSAFAQDATPAAGAAAFIVVRRYTLVENASMDELETRVEEGFLPIITAIPGFQEYLFVDAGDGDHLTVSLFDNKSSAAESTRGAAAWAAENVVELIKGPPDVTEGWVRIHVTA